jgi:hypothetical protein
MGVNIKDTGLIIYKKVKVYLPIQMETSTQANGKRDFQMAKENCYKSQNISRRPNKWASQVSKKSSSGPTVQNT